MSLFNVAEQIIFGEDDFVIGGQVNGGYEEAYEYKLLIFAEHCINYYIYGIVDPRLERTYSKKGLILFFEDKRKDLMRWMMGNNSAFSGFINLRPSIKLFLKYFADPNDFSVWSVNYPKNSSLVVQQIKDARDKERNSFERRARKNRRSIRELVRSIYQARSKVLVLRIDLWYEYFGAINKDENEGLIFHREDIESITRHRDEFINYIRERFLNNLLGYVWRLEYGLRKGYHLHFLIMLDGQFHCNDVMICKSLGEFWKNEITKNQGGYFNCNALKKKYKNLAIGMTHYSEEEKRSAIEKIVGYFTKFDLFFQVKTKGNYRTLGRSGLMVMTANKKGRPRLN